MGKSSPSTSEFNKKKVEFKNIAEIKILLKIFSPCPSYALNLAMSFNNTLDKFLYLIIFHNILQ